MQIFKSVPQFDFYGKRKFFFILSVFLVTGSILSIVFKGFNFGIDFTGGTIIQVQFADRVDIGDVRNKIQAGFNDSFSLIQFGNEADNEVLFTIPTKGDEKENEEMSLKIRKVLTDSFPKSEVRRVESIGPKTGAALKESAVYAILFTFLAILAYMAFRFQYYFGLGAILALFHDTIVVLGAFSVFNREFDLTTLAAVLMINGYSLNDTIIIFDRIRENITLHPSKSIPEQINVSTNETLSRTIITAFTTLVVVIALYFFGGPSVNNFAFSIIIGIAIGTYSSVFVAAPILVLFNKSDKMHSEVLRKESAKANVSHG